MGKKEDLDDFYTLIKGFSTASTGYRDARELIDGIYQRLDLSQILEMEHPGSDILGVLVQHPTLKALLFYFCKVNPVILTKPLNVTTPDGRVVSSTLIKLFQSHEPAQSEIAQWINTQQPVMASDEKQSTESASCIWPLLTTSGLFAKAPKPPTTSQIQSLLRYVLMKETIKSAQFSLSVVMSEFQEEYESLERNLFRKNL